MRKKTEEKKCLDELFKTKADELKALLKSSKCKVGIRVLENTIQLQATLPPKPDSRKTTPYQQLIGLNIPATLDGLETAREEAFELGRLIARKIFVWNDKYLPKKTVKANDKPVFTSEIIERFETEYFKTRKQSEISKHSCAKYLTALNRILNAGCNVFSQGSLDEFYDGLTNTHTKEEISVIVKIVSTMFKLDVRLTRPKREKPKSRPIPTDEEIKSEYWRFRDYGENKRHVNGRHVDAWQLNQWIYGMLATFGLRPRELFMNPDIKWWLSPENTDNTWKVDEDTKTGSRLALPLHPEWIMLFSLKDKSTLELYREYIAGKTTFRNVNVCVSNINKWFRKLDIPFQPYDLRHAWAIRAHLLGIPIKAAADNLGHSVEIHTKTYQRWFSFDNRKKAINEALDKQTDSDTLKEEIFQLKLENERLKIELERYKLNSAYSIE
ncbi:site-specific integrase [Brunnivagina elsteri]|nr:site-specific integrase [Calothrix elsteri]